MVDWFIDVGCRCWWSDSSKDVFVSKHHVYLVPNSQVCFASSFNEIICVHELTRVFFQKIEIRSEISIRSTSPMFVWMALPQNSRVFCSLWRDSQENSGNSDPPNPNRWKLILLLVQKSQGQPPGMSIKHIKPCKKMGFQLPNLNWFWRHARFLKHQQYSHPPQTNHWQQGLRPALDPKRFGKDYVLHLGDHDFPTPEKRVCVLVKRGRRYVETSAGESGDFCWGGEHWGRLVGLFFFWFYVRVCVCVCVCVCCLSLKKWFWCVVFFCKQKVLREFKAEDWYWYFWKAIFFNWDNGCISDGTFWVSKVGF